MKDVDWTEEQTDYIWQLLEDARKDLWLSDWGIELDIAPADKSNPSDPRYARSAETTVQLRHLFVQFHLMPVLLEYVKDALKGDEHAQDVVVSTIYHAMAHCITAPFDELAETLEFNKYEENTRGIFHEQMTERVARLGKQVRVFRLELEAPKEGE